MFDYPILAGDIGGTNIRLAIAETPEADLVLLPALATRDVAGIEDAVARACAGRAAKPASAIICVAGPVQGRSARLTNGDWGIDGAQCASILGLRQGLLLNDFEAVALSIPALRPQDVVEIVPAGEQAAASGVRLVLGPGTGLGVAALATVSGRHVPLPSEAGHMDFAPDGEEQARLFALIERPFGRLTAETILSGPGLARLHHARLTMSGRAAGARLEAADIAARAAQNPGGPEAATIRLFWRLAARFAGDMALAFLARGGVTLAGGILPKLLPWLDRDDFARAFRSKTPMQALAAQIPVALATDEAMVLRGMHAVAAAPGRYGLDYAARLWVRT